MSREGSGAAVPVEDELRCQYSSKRCENPRTNKKSGGLHKFCAMHREKANRNQMRLDHRRRVLKKQMQMQMREQQMQMQRQRALSAPAAMAAGAHYSAPMTVARPRAMRTYGQTQPNAWTTTQHQISNTQQQTQTFAFDSVSTPAASIFSALDLQILETLLFSDEEQPDVSPHCSDSAQTTMLLRSPSFVNV